MDTTLYSMLSSYDNVLVKDPQVDSWLFMSNPFAILALLVGYLCFVLRLGPNFMATRKPFNMKNVLVAYNLYQILFNAWFSSVPIRLGVAGYLVSSVCHKRLTSDSRYAVALTAGAWWYFMSKVVDLLDTVFFVLRKKQEQVTFLHVYHHTVTCLFSWGYLKYLPGEQGVVIGFLNSIVHVFMYTYYMIAALGPKYARYLWWKKYITWMQFGQFFLMLAYLCTLLALDCKLPKILTFFFIANVTVFLFLFVRFYRRAYCKNRPSK